MAAAIKFWTRQTLALTDEFIVSVSEFSCGKPTCPNQHTAIMVMSLEGPPGKFPSTSPSRISPGAGTSPRSRGLRCAPVRCPPIVEAGCSSSPPIPASGIAPERISRVRTLLDGLPTAPGLAVALPGVAPTGASPRGGPASRRRPRARPGRRVPSRGRRRRRLPKSGGGAGSQELAAAEDRPPARPHPTPRRPRPARSSPSSPARPPAASRPLQGIRSAPTRTPGVGVATAARLVLTASAGPDGPRRRRGPPPARRLAPGRVPPGRHRPARGRVPRRGPRRRVGAGWGRRARAGVVGAVVAPAVGGPVAPAVGSPVVAPALEPALGTALGAARALVVGKRAAGPVDPARAVPTVVPAARSAAASSPGGAAVPRPAPGVLPAGPDEHRRRGR